MHHDESAVFETPVGWICAVLRNGQLHELTFGHASPEAAFRAIKHSDAVPSEPRKPLRHLIRRLQSFLQRPKDDFLDVEINLEKYTEFQRAIVQGCRVVPIGQTVSYGELAKTAGYPKAARAVGQVMACNRFPLIVPCHRVIASGGSIGGFSARHGVRMKRLLLDLEQTGGRKVGLSRLPR